MSLNSLVIDVMNNVIVALVWMFKNIWPVPVFVFVLGSGAYFLLGYYHKSIGINESLLRDRLGQFTLLATFFAIPLSWGFASSITVPMINTFGLLTQGEVLSSFRTSILYNEEPVIGYRVSYVLKDGQIFESSFKTNDFNVYPQSNIVRYPTVGARFSLKYLEKNPHFFIIINDPAIED